MNISAEKTFSIIHINPVETESMKTNLHRNKIEEDQISNVANETVEILPDEFQVPLVTQSSVNLSPNMTGQLGNLPSQTVNIPGQTVNIPGQILNLPPMIAHSVNLPAISGHVVNLPPFVGQTVNLPPFVGQTVNLPPVVGGQAVILPAVDHLPTHMLDVGDVVLGGDVCGQVVGHAGGEGQDGGGEGEVKVSQVNVL